MRRRRDLTALERALWRSVTRDVSRLEGSSPPGRTSASPPKAPEIASGPTAASGGLGKLAATLSRSGAAPAGGKAAPAKPALSKRPRVLPPSYTPPQSRPGGAPGSVSAQDRAMLEARTRKRLRRGQAEPDARIDLHGMRQAGAHEALRHFILASRARGHRVVLVVTGKGEPVGTPARLAANEGRGVLRRAVPRWLALPDMAPHVIGFEPASQRHGGEGALYVRLRR